MGDGVGKGGYFSRGHARRDLNQSSLHEVVHGVGEVGLHLGPVHLGTRGRGDDVGVNHAKSDAGSEQLEDAVVIVHGAGDVKGKPFHFMECRLRRRRDKAGGRCRGDDFANGLLLRQKIGGAIRIRGRQSVGCGASNADQYEIGLVRLQDFGNCDAVGLELGQTHPIARLGEVGGDCVGYETLDGGLLAGCAIRAGFGWKR